MALRSRMSDSTYAVLYCECLEVLTGQLAGSLENEIYSLDVETVVLFVELQTDLSYHVPILKITYLATTPCRIPFTTVSGLTSTSHAPDTGSDTSLPFRFGFMWSSHT